MDPVLNGAPGFTLLTFVVALAAYLRQVSVNAQDRIEQIETNKHPDVWPVLPSPAEHTLDRLNLLQDTKRHIEWLTRPLFTLIVAVGLRAVLHASSRIPSSDSIYPYVQFASAWWSAEWLRRIDLVLTVLLSLLVFAMWVMHELGQCKERRVVAKLSAWRSKKRSTKEAATEKSDV